MSLFPERHGPLSPPRTRDPSPQSSKAEQLRQVQQLHVTQTLLNWRRLRQNQAGAKVLLNGNALEVADVVAVARYGTAAGLTESPRVRQRIEDSIKVLHKHLRNGHVVYGVTTGFGGSADTRTTDLESLQRALVQHQSSGVLSEADIGRAYSTQSNDYSSDFEADFDHQSMPTTWVRASMLARCNSIIRGHSAVRMEVAETIMALLHHEITPIVPLRGSVSASGDLSPLSYIASAIEGNPDVYVRCGKGTDRIVPANIALQEAGIEPVVLQAKEGLGLLNGTAFSAATATLAIYRSQELIVLSQILTAMGVEAMTGSAESFYPQIAVMRPHPGQIESASNILSFLSESHLAQCVQIPKNTNMTGLCQDRYCWRTASQWIGPQIEDLMHAQQQLEVELNSTTDNPLIDVENDHILHGGNFQAAVVTSTMDRTRLALEKIGRMLFAQATEIINPAMNKGLPPNLSSDDPSLSYTCKGIDINVAAYASELGFLANPVGNHVMSAEMHNQAINSMALVSSRYTFEALDILTMMSAAYLFMVCQALDLRVLQIEFMKIIENQIPLLVAEFFPTLATEAGSDTSSTSNSMAVLTTSILASINSTWSTTSGLDLIDRCSKIADGVVNPLARHFAGASAAASAQGTASQPGFLEIMSFSEALKKFVYNTYDQTRSKMYNDHVEMTSGYLGKASQRMYKLVRVELGIRFHRGLIEHPLMSVVEGVTKNMTPEEAQKRRTVGSQVSMIYEALKDTRGSLAMQDVVERMFC